MKDEQEKRHNFFLGDDLIFSKSTLWTKLMDSKKW